MSLNKKVKSVTSHFKEKKILIVVFLILLIIFIVLVFRLVSGFGTFNAHRDYFKQPVADQHIQAWMTFSMIERRYNVDVATVLHKQLQFSEIRNTISTYCVKEKVDCNKLVQELDNNKK